MWAIKMSSRHVDHIRMAPHGYQPAAAAGTNQEPDEDETPPRSPLMPVRRSHDPAGRKSPVMQARRIPDMRLSPLAQPKHRRSPAMQAREALHTRPSIESSHSGDHELQALAQPVESATPETDTTRDQNVANGNHVVMMTGTIKRGHKTGADVEVALKLTTEEAHKLQASFVKEQQDKRSTGLWGPRKGLHILIWTFLCFPFAFIISFCFSFYIGTVAWYNVFLYLSEERTLWHKALLAPVVIILYPFLIVIAALSLGLFGACKQISWFLSSWLKAMRDPEKGFFGTLCQKLGVPQCSPYEVVILDDPIGQTDAAVAGQPDEASAV